MPTHYIPVGPAMHMPNGNYYNAYTGPSHPVQTPAMTYPAGNIQPYYVNGTPAPSSHMMPMGSMEANNMMLSAAHQREQQVISPFQSVSATDSSHSQPRLPASSTPCRFYPNCKNGANCRYLHPEVPAAYYNEPESDEEES